jgi:iron complex outermembrane receptor protein
MIDAPAAMVVLNRSDFALRGYDSLDDVMRDLVGFDTIITNGTEYTVAYQRGYRTPWTQRTLLLLNGRVINHLWNHTAMLSRQFPLSALERIEVLYGPASVLYGPNAFLGVINLITRDPEQLESGEQQISSWLELGSYHSQAIDFTAIGRHQDIQWLFAYRDFYSDEPDISDYSYWGFTDPQWLTNSGIWGQPVASGDLDGNGQIDPVEMHEGQPLNVYHDPSYNQSYLVELAYDRWRAGSFSMQTREGYGPYYSFKDAQPNQSWGSQVSHTFVEHHFEGPLDVAIDTRLTFRQDRVAGGWVESFANFVSISDWLAEGESRRFDQIYSWQSNDAQWSAGIKFESKQLSKAYVICGYYADALCPQQSSPGVGVVDSSTATAQPLPVPAADIPSYNKVRTRDVGGYLQRVWNAGRWRYNLGLRLDNNSLYGSEISPRMAAIYHPESEYTVKFLYGEAFQEPSPKDLYGGWNGRLANPNLKPEKVEHYETVFMLRSENWLHDISMFYSNYSQVIAGGGWDNIGGRTIAGLEYRLSFQLPNPVSADKITGRFDYSYLKARSEQQYDNVSRQWIAAEDEQGDVAPHKIRFHISWPFTDRFIANAQLNWTDQRPLFSLNPLRAEYNANATANRKAEAYTTLDLTLRYQWELVALSFKIENALNQDYLQPGVENAASGDDFATDADGFQNSLLPQVAERSFWLKLQFDW